MCFVCVCGGGCLTVQKKTHDATSEGGIVETFRNFCFRLDETWEGDLPILYMYKTRHSEVNWLKLYSELVMKLDV